jgi:septal ring factor EnvC (AmiA/AmiB activator)
LGCLLAWTFASAGAAAASKTENSKEALSDLHERIEALTKELESAQEAHGEAADALKESERAISETNRKLFEINQQHQQNRDTLLTLQQQKFNLEATIQQQQQLLGAQLYQQYLHGQQNYAQIILQQQDPGAIARQLHYFSYVSRARADLIASMQANLGQVAKLNDETADTLKHITELKAEQEKQRRELQAQKDERGKVLKKLSSQINTQRGEISKLKRDEKNLSELVERLARIVPKVKPRIRQSRKANGHESADNESSSQVPVGRNETLPSNEFDGGNFAALRGKLRLPVRGDITNRFGAVRQDTGVSWKGLFIKSAEGSEVKSIASGRVVFADWLRGFGNLLIVDHGDGYMSLYGNNQALLKKVGETVSSGDAIASVGNSGGNETSGLYFELRYQSKPFDPLSWSVVK